MWGWDRADVVIAMNEETYQHVKSNLPNSASFNNIKKIFKPQTLKEIDKGWEARTYKTENGKEQISKIIYWRNMELSKDVQDLFAEILKDQKEEGWALLIAPVDAYSKIRKKGELCNIPTRFRSNHVSKEFAEENFIQNMEPFDMLKEIEIEYLKEKENTIMENTKIENQKTVEKEAKTIDEKYLEEQKKMVDYIAKYVEQNNELPWNSDEFPKKMAQENGEKSLDAMYEGKDPGKARYSDFSQMKLSLVAMDKGYKDNRWVTYNYIKDRDAYVHHGEHAEKIFIMAKTEPDKDITDSKAIKYQNVFNVQQTGMLPMPAVQEQPINNKIHLIDEAISKKPELQAEIEANKTPKDKYAYAEILHNFGRGDEISAKPGPTITKDSSPDEIRKEIVAEISSAFLKQTFKSNVSEKERPNKLDPKIAVEYLKAHPEEMGAICKDAEVNRQNSIAYLKAISKELTETKTQEQKQEQGKEQIQQQKVKKEKVVTKKKEKKGLER